MTILRKLFLSFGVFALAVSSVQKTKAVDVYGVNVSKGALAIAATVPVAIGCISFKEPIGQGLNWACNTWNGTQGKLGIATTLACVSASATLNNAEHNILASLPVGLLGAYFTHGLVEKWGHEEKINKLYRFNEFSVEKSIFTYTNPDKAEFMQLEDWVEKKDDSLFKNDAIEAMTKSTGFGIDQHAWTDELKNLLQDLQDEILALNSSTGLMQKIKKQTKFEGSCTLDNIVNLFVYGSDSLSVKDYTQKGFGALMHGEVSSLLKVYKKSFWTKLVNGSDFNARVKLQWALLKKYATINFVLNEYVCKTGFIPG